MPVTTGTPEPYLGRELGEMDDEERRRELLPRHFDAKARGSRVPRIADGADPGMFPDG